MTDLHRPDAPGSAQGDFPVPPPPKGVGAPPAGSTPDSSTPAGAGGGGGLQAGLRLAVLVGALVALGFWNPWMLVVIAALVAMITLHEFGHYIMAKRAGMKVTEFFLFFGPKIWSIKRGETEYGIKCIPAGAYVKIIGMHNLEEVPAADEGRTYRQKSFAQRVGVAVAGSTMHFLLALAMIFVALVAIGQPGGTLDPNQQAKEWRIADVTPGSGADQAGLAAGDKVTNIDGVTIKTFDDLRDAVGTRSGNTVPVSFVRDGRTITKSITLAPFYSWRVARVVPGSGPAAAGLEVGDQITSIDGTSTGDVRDLDAVLAGVEGQTVPVRYERPNADGTETPGQTDVQVENLILAGGEGYLGVGREDAPDERVSPLRALVRTPVEFAKVTQLSVTSLGKFFTPGGVSDFAGQVGNARDKDAGVEGPTVPRSDASSATLLDNGVAQPGANRLLSIVGLVRIGADAGAVNPGGLITLFALINIFIGVFNLVPMLPFDGGHVLIAAYEKVQEKRLHRKRYFADVAKLLPITYVVVIALGLLFVSTLYLDIANPLQIR